MLLALIRGASIFLALTKEDTVDEDEQEAGREEMNLLERARRLLRRLLIRE